MCCRTVNNPKTSSALPFKIWKYGYFFYLVEQYDSLSPGGGIPVALRTLLPLPLLRFFFSWALPILWSCFLTRDWTWALSSENMESLTTGLPGNSHSAPPLMMPCSPCLGAFPRYLLTCLGKSPTCIHMCSWEQISSISWQNNISWDFGDETADFFALPKRGMLSCSLTFLALIFSLRENRNTNPVGLNRKLLSLRGGSADWGEGLRRVIA